MKQLFSAFIFALISAVSLAQCTTCTINITGNDAADHVISIGQVMCIQPTAHVTGRLYVTSGGKICNQGHIHSSNMYVAAGGEFDNYGAAAIDTFYISDASAVFRNYDTMTIDLAGAGQSATLTNSGVMTCTSYWDTAATFTNYGSFATRTNIYIGDNSHFNNYRKLHIGGNLYNGPLSNILTTCVITIDSGWYNSGTISGPASGCGGFAVGGLTYNSGTVGATGHIDICDAGHPANGVDGSTTPLTGVTFCQCTDTCTDLPSGISYTTADRIDFSIYPNPASDRIQVYITDGQAVGITICDAIGQTVYSGAIPAGTHGREISTSSFAGGLYILTLQSDGRRTSRRVEVVR